MNKFWLIIVVGITLLIGCNGKTEKTSDKTGTPEVNRSDTSLKSPPVNLNGARVLIIIAPQDFRDEEYRIPRERLEKSGARVTVASSSLDEAVGMLKEVKVKADVLLKDAKMDDYSAVIFVGGAGAKIYFQNGDAQRIAREAQEKNKVLGAICLAPVILANTGILKNKKATVYESEKETLKNSGALYEDQKVIQDGLIITANGPAATDEFAERFISALKSNLK